MGVSQVMKAQRRELGLVHDPCERLVEGVRVDEVAVPVGEHPLLRVVDADGGELGGLNACQPASTATVVLSKSMFAPGGASLAAGLV